MPLVIHSPHAAMGGEQVIRISNEDRPTPWERASTVEGGLWPSSPVATEPRARYQCAMSLLSH